MKYGGSSVSYRARGFPSPSSSVNTTHLSELHFRQRLSCVLAITVMTRGRCGVFWRVDSTLWNMPLRNFHAGAPCYTTTLW